MLSRPSTLSSLHCASPSLKCSNQASVNCWKEHTEMLFYRQVRHCEFALLLALRCFGLHNLRRGAGVPDRGQTWRGRTEVQVAARQHSTAATRSAEGPTPTSHYSCKQRNSTFCETLYFEASASEIGGLTCVHPVLSHRTQS